jgi:hypothetical protein
MLKGLGACSWNQALSAAGYGKGVIPEWAEIGDNIL